MPECCGGCWVVATGGKLWPPAAGTIPIPPVLPAGKGEAGLILTLFSIPALPTFSFPITRIALALASHPRKGKMQHYL